MDALIFYFFPQYIKKLQHMKNVVENIRILSCLHMII